MEGTITISLEGASFEQTERCRRIIHTLFEEGVFAVKRGKAILSFDETGALGSIELQVLKWRRDKPEVYYLQDIWKSAKIELTKPLPQTESRQLVK